MNIVRDVSITLEVSPDGEIVTLTVGSEAEQFPVGEFFATDWPDLQLLHNLRLASVITNTTDLQSALFRDWINGNGGVQLRGRNVFLGPISKTVDAYLVNYGPTVDSTDYGITIPFDALEDRPRDLRFLAYNCAARLRLRGHSTLNPLAIADVTAQPYKSF